MGVGRLPRTNKHYLAACACRARACRVGPGAGAGALRHSGKKFQAPASHRAAVTRRLLPPFT